MEYKEPFMVNGVLITESVIKELNYIQTGNFWIESAPVELSNAGFKSYKEDISNVVSHLIDTITLLDLDDPDRLILVQQLENMGSIQRSFNSFCVPEDLQTSQTITKANE